MDAEDIECGICGTFRVLMMPHFSAALEHDTALIPYLRAHTRQETEAGRRAVLTVDNWRELASGHRHTRVSRKLEKLLGRLAGKSTRPGLTVSTETGRDYPLFDAAGPDEVEYFLKHLAERKLIGSLAGDLRSCVVTPEGWDRIEGPAIGGIPGRCFIAMSFDPGLDDAFERGIKLAIEDDCKLTAVRVDRIHHNEKICDRILAEIRRSQLMVADFTMQRHNVYFEAGFAIGLGRPVIWSCREDEIAGLRFDTRQYNHIAWTNPDDLRQKLADRINATVLTAR